MRFKNTLTIFKNDLSDFKNELSKNIEKSKFPDGFFSSWEYCDNQQKNQLCHPVMMALIVKTLFSMNKYNNIFVDPRLQIKNIEDDKKLKWQPDIFCSNIVPNNKDYNPELLLDFESPNSSDMRVASRNINSYNSLYMGSSSSIPYIIIVCLPECFNSKWGVRYTKGYNSFTEKNQSELKKELQERGPRDTWKKYWRKYISEHSLSVDNIHIINIGNDSVESIDLR